MREALIDIQFDPPISLERLDAFVAELQLEYPRQTDLWEAVVGVNVDGSVASTNSTHAKIGKRLDSDVLPHVLQCRLGGFTLSRLCPYGEWQDLRDESQKMWALFYKIVGPETITRLAVRYINEIKLPLPISDFSDYFTCAPQIPESLPQVLSGFLQRVIIPDEAEKCVSIVTHALEGSQPNVNDGASITVILDIDVFRTTSIEASNFDEIWNVLDVLRAQKNRMFFEHLTETAVRIFE